MYIISRKDLVLDGNNPTILYAYGGFNIAMLPSFSPARLQNCFDDFQFAAKWLSAYNYARPSKIGINGGSNGGLLVGACINQAPSLFGAAVAQVGVLDMYRFHKFTIGAAWKCDYGNPDVAEDFAVVQKYSPLHNVQADKQYPATLIMTGDHDDR
eukprot:jgi/Hompol1/4314/HPOL_007070-RA